MEEGFSYLIELTETAKTATYTRYGNFKITLHRQSVIRNYEKAMREGM